MDRTQKNKKSGGGYYEDDEALARALQEEYSREFRRQQQRRSHTGGRATTAPGASARHGSSGGRGAPATTSESLRPSARAPSSSSVSPRRSQQQRQTSPRRTAAATGSRSHRQERSSSFVPAGANKFASRSDRGGRTAAHRSPNSATTSLTQMQYARQVQQQQQMSMLAAQEAAEPEIRVPPARKKSGELLPAATAPSGELLVPSKASDAAAAAMPPAAGRSLTRSRSGELSRTSSGELLPFERARSGRRLTRSMSGELSRSSSGELVPYERSSSGRFQPPGRTRSGELSRSASGDLRPYVTSPSGRFQPPGRTRSGELPSGRLADPESSEQHEVVLSDAEYARQLQEELRLEEEGGQRLGNSATFVVSSNSPSQRAPPAPAAPPPGIHSDEELARRLQQQIQQEESIFAASRKNKASNAAVAVRTPSTSSSLSSEDLAGIPGAVGGGGGGAVAFTSDERVAMRVEQELRDEEIARRLSTAEADRLSAYRARQVSQNQNEQHQASRCCAPRKLFVNIMSFLILAGAAGGVTWYFLKGKDQLGDFWPSPEDFRDEDPFAGEEGSEPWEVERWRSNGKGLKMELVSALEDDWYLYFRESVQEWDDGTPDALELRTSFIEHDPTCEPINFKIKVCNSDYGATMWRGINKILLTDTYIFASAARMNEYYFRGTDDAQRHYTMCHEVGHGYGLPHSDEDFTNADLGNCMDYTNNPEANMMPGTYNYEFLADMYGTVPGSATSPEQRNRMLRTRRAPEEEHQELQRIPEEIPEWVMAKWRELDEETENHSHGTERRLGSGWRVLHESEHGEAHEIDIGQGYRIQVHKLLAHE